MYKGFSVFSGIEAASVGLKGLIEIIAHAQYEPNDKVQFASKVLEYHYPNVPNLGDVTKITEEQVKDLGHFDILIGGSPCQDLSLAGKRASLKNEDGSLTRSGLFDYQMQIFEWARRNNGCRFMLWENVPGCLSSGRKVKGSDFAYILGTMVQRDVPVPKDGWKNSGICTSADWSRIVEWRTLDAQYFRETPQRRRRVFALLDTGAWWCRKPILFESEGSCWDTKTSESTQEDPAKDSGEYTSRYSGWGGQTYSWMPRCLQSNPTRDVSQPLTMTDYKDPSLVGYPKAISMRTGNSKSNGHGFDFDDKAYTLDTHNDFAVGYPSSHTVGGGNLHDKWKPSRDRDERFTDIENEGLQGSKHCTGGGTTMIYPPTASGKDIFPTLTSIQSSKIWLGNQEAFSGDYWIMEKKDG